MDKQFYIDNCPAVVPLFHQPFWLDIVCGDNWNVIVVKENNQLIGTYVYYLKQVKQDKNIQMPFLTQNMGPWLIMDKEKTFDRISLEIKFLEQILERMPSFSKFYQKWDYNFQNWLPFYWAGYTQTTKYTYVLDNITNIDDVWKNLKGSVRTDIKKAEKILKAVDGNSNSGDLYTLITKTFRQRGMPPPYSISLINNIVQLAVEKNFGKLFFGVDENNQIHGAVFVVWSNQKAYYLIGASDPSFRSSGVNSFLLWEAIKHCSSFNQKFDFEGSMIKNIEYFFRSFGATQKMYFELYKNQTIAAKFVDKTKSIVKKFIS